MMKKFYREKFVSQIILLNTNELSSLGILSLAKLSKLFANHFYHAGIEYEDQSIEYNKLNNDISSFVKLLKGIKKFSFDYQKKKLWEILFKFPN